MSETQAQLNAIDERVTNIETQLETLADNVLALKDILDSVADVLVIDEPEAKQNDETMTNTMFST